MYDPLPPGPRAPGLLQALRWSTRALPFMERCQRRFGDLFTLRNFRGDPIVFVHHPEGIREVMTADAESLRVSNLLLEPALGSNSLLLLNGARHRRERRLMSPPFHGQRMRLYAGLIHEVTTRALERATAGGRRELGLHPVFRDVSLDVILRAVLGVPDARLAEAAEILREATDSFTTPLVFIPPLQRDLGPASPGRRFQRARRRVRTFLEGQIEARREATGEHHDILSLLIAARDEHGEAMTTEEIRDELMTLTVAGHETTATALAWAVHWVHRAPGVLPRLRAELDALGPEPDPEAYARAPYLAAVCDETMRRMPVVPNVGRYAKRSFTLMGRRLPPGTAIAPCIYLTHLRPDIYPEPREFRPERFLERSFSPFEYLPFGGGARRCLGAAFALFEMRIALGVLLRRYHVETLDARTVPVRRTIVHAPRRETPARVRARA